MTKFEQLCENVMNTFDPYRIRPQSVVIIDSDALQNEDIKKDIITRRGPGYYSQLLKMANDGQNLYVSALKTIRSTNQVYGSGPNTDLYEADVINYVPGLIGTWGQTLTLPVSILKVSVPPEMITQIPVSGEDRQIGNSEGDNSYNNGQQHPNVVNQKQTPSKVKKKK
jgi:hypothetical protein